MPIDEVQDVNWEVDELSSTGKVDGLAPTVLCDLASEA